MEFVKDGETLTIDSYKGVVELALTDTWHDSENNFLLSYAEWDELVMAVEEYRSKEEA